MQAVTGDSSFNPADVRMLAQDYLDLYNSKESATDFDDSEARLAAMEFASKLPVSDSDAILVAAYKYKAFLKGDMDSTVLECIGQPKYGRFYQLVLAEQ